VGAGGRAIHAEPPLNSGTAMPPPPLSCIGRREIARDAEERNPGRVGQKKRRRKEFLLLGFGGPPPSALAYPISDRLLINFLSP